MVCGVESNCIKHRLLKKKKRRRKKSCKPTCKFYLESDVLPYMATLCCLLSFFNQNSAVKPCAYPPQPDSTFLKLEPIGLIFTPNSQPLLQVPTPFLYCILTFLCILIFACGRSVLSGLKS
jgi:hypothetical protein